MTVLQIPASASSARLTAKHSRQMQNLVRKLTAVAHSPSKRREVQQQISALMRKQAQEAAAVVARDSVGERVVDSLGNQLGGKRR